MTKRKKPWQAKRVHPSIVEIDCDMEGIDEQWVLLRSTEDAMTGIVWHDDSQIVEQNIHRTYSSSEDTGARITVYSITSRSPAHQTSTRMQEWQEGRQSFASIDSHDKAKKAVASKASSPVHS